MTDENKGAVHIAEDVIASVAALAATEVDGVSSLTGGADLFDFAGRKHLSKGVKITVAGGEVTADVAILVKYGAVIPQVAAKVQESVAGAVEAMTGMKTAAVNVNVAGVSFVKDVKK